jgi:hypothetical protein
MGSSSLNAEVNAFDKLHMVRISNSGYLGVKYSIKIAKSLMQAGRKKASA